ncbi:hypothetical protein QBC39DRAFT_278942 [Podospora conica]|nr:hypothetical protein QBC39DRAFT_278942 [Schizothecium conicum]
MTSTTLPPPVVVDPTVAHTHTIIFLHRFPTPLPTDLTPRLLSTKRPRDHRPLATQFPSIRWVYPFHKPPPAARPYANLTPADRAAVGLDARTTSPYITQLVLQEGRRLNGLDRVILGGQGETSEAAHEALFAFPDVLPDWMTEDEPRLVGFVGMHADVREQTRDVKAYSITTKMDEGDERRPGRVGRAVVRRTPHRFIHGGYKVQTQTWDGKRIDEMAKFLEEEMGVERIPTEEQRKNLGKEILTPKDREKKPEEVKETLTEGQKYALELAKDKKANDELAEKVRIRIEADKVERKIRQERERQKRRAAAAGQAPRTPMANNNNDDDEYSHSDAYNSDEEIPADGGRLPKRRAKKRGPGRVASEGQAWQGGSRARGEMTEAQMRALGLIEEETVKEEDI